ncbi:MAG TPA: glycosyltransferase [Steroidobacteraceae bacterium]|jgi:glycosyltransferase involved in cell wall biosynthesis|nr:glycosyltransferase [Steroidobacteraceae bacterium]
MPGSLTQDLVSVVIASYNMGHFLAQAVQSVLAQSYTNVEVQIVDDGSDDDTAVIVERWREDPRVHVHRQDNGGQARAKNQGVVLSRGRFVAFLDADDFWLPDKLALQMPLFQGRPEVGVVYSDYQGVDGDGRPLPQEPPRLRRGWVSGALLIENFIPYSTGVVRRACLERYGGFDETLRMGIDYDLWLRLSAHFQFDFVPEKTLHYRIWSGQMSKNYRRRYESAIRIMEDFIDNNPGLVSRALIREAWAHTYVGRGNTVLWREEDRVAAYHDFLRALSFVPWYWPAWRSMLRALITTRAP